MMMVMMMMVMVMVMVMVLPIWPSPLDWLSTVTWCYRVGNVV
jgi:hypothetical protein